MTWRDIVNSLRKQPDFDLAQNKLDEACRTFNDELKKNIKELRPDEDIKFYVAMDLKRVHYLQWPDYKESQQATPNRASIQCSLYCEFPEYLKVDPKQFAALLSSVLKDRDGSPFAKKLGSEWAISLSQSKTKETNQLANVGNDSNDVTYQTECLPQGIAVEVELSSESKNRIIIDFDRTLIVEEHMVALHGSPLKSIPLHERPSVVHDKGLPLADQYDLGMAAIAYMNERVKPLANALLDSARLSAAHTQATPTSQTTSITVQGRNDKPAIEKD